MPTNIFEKLKEISELADAVVQGTMEDRESKYKTVYTEDLNKLHLALADLKELQEIAEPIFILLGRDPQAPELIRQWVEVRHKAAVYRGTTAGKGMIDISKAASAKVIASQMEVFKINHPEMGLPLDIFEQVKGDMIAGD